MSKQEILKRKFQKSPDGEYNPVHEAMDEYYNQAIEEALQQVEKYNTGKELTPIVTAIINSIKQLKK